MRGIRVAFFDAQFLMWPRGKKIDESTVIKEEDGGLYKIKGIDIDLSTRFHTLSTPFFDVNL